MRLPWVSREMHDAVLAERERVIVALRVQIAMLEKRFERPTAVTVTLPKDFAVLQPALIHKPSRKKRLDGEVLPAAPNIDLADLDENDEKTLATVAVSKFGRRASNTWELAQWIRGIKIEISAAKAAKRRRKQQEASHPAEEMAELQTGTEKSVVPAHILEQIADAERGED